MNHKPSQSNRALLRLLKYGLVLLILFISVDLAAEESRNQEINSSNRVFQDSLIIRKNNGQKAFIIKKGREIKLWADRPAKKGTFLALENDTVSIESNGAILKYHKNDISKIKIFENIERNIIGGALKIWGGAIMVASIVPLITLGPGGLIISVPGWIVGYGIYTLGDIISGNRKLNLRKKWSIN